MSTTTANETAAMFNRTESEDATFGVVTRPVHCPYKAQFYVDWGDTNGGPWFRVGLNSTEYGIGYLPTTVVKPTLVQ